MFFVYYVNILLTKKEKKVGKIKLVIGLMVVAFYMIGCGGGGGGSVQKESSSQGDSNTPIIQKDTTPPKIEIKKGSSELTLGICQGYQAPELVAYDDVDGEVAIIPYSGFNNFDTCSPATYTLTYKAEDKSGNVSYLDITVKVEGIKIVLKEGESIKWLQYEEFQDPGYNIISSDSNYTIDISGEVNSDKLGIYSITYYAKTSSGYESNVTRLVEVVKNPNVLEHQVSNTQEFRKALDEAANNGKDDVILLSKGVYTTSDDGIGTFTYSDSENQRLLIYGEENNRPILNGDNFSRVLEVKYTNPAFNSILILKHLEIKNSTDDGVFSNASKVKIYNSYIHSNQERGVYVLGDLYFNTALIEKNKGGSYNKGGIEVINSKFYKNEANNGGGVFVELPSNRSIYINGSNFSYNSVLGEEYSKGGAIYVTRLLNTPEDKYSIVLIKNSNIEYNKAILGGGVYLDYIEQLIHIAYSKINNNEANQYGGIYVHYAYNEIFYINDSEIGNNQAVVFGGLAINTHLYMSRCKVFNNIAFNSNVSSAIYIGSDEDVWGGGYNESLSYIIESNISNNIVHSYHKEDELEYYSTVMGGAAFTHNNYLDDKNIAFINCIIKNNQLNVYGNENVVILGSTIFTPKEDDLILINNTISGNRVKGTTNIKGAVYGKGIIANNIIDEQSGVYIAGDSYLYNNAFYADKLYNADPDNIFIQKKDNIDLNFNPNAYNKETLYPNTILVDKGIFPPIEWFNNEDSYNTIKKLLKYDFYHNKRDENIDIGAIEQIKNSQN